MPFLNYILQIFVSVIVILLIHYLYNYLKDTFTVKKTKDMYQFHQDKYNEIFETIKQERNNKSHDSEKDQNELLQIVMDNNTSFEQYDFKDMEQSLVDFSLNL